VVQIAVGDILEMCAEDNIVGLIIREPNLQPYKCPCLYYVLNFEKSYKQNYVNVSEVHLRMRLVVCPLLDCSTLPLPVLCLYGHGQWPIEIEIAVFGYG
jgi:hypothetical protein